jgi:Flp pilus assembly pilin Flp
MEITMSKKNTASKKIEKRSHPRSLLLEDTRGVTTVEYIILLALVAIGAYAAWTAFGTDVQNKVTEAGGSVSTMDVTHP